MSTETSQMNNVPPMQGLNQTLEIELVEGYSRPGKRLEVEITAKR